MTMTHDEAQTAAREHLLLHFTKHDAVYRDGGELLVLERGQDPYVFDSRGRQYIDSLSSCSAPAGLLVRRGDGRGDLAQLTTLAFNTNWGTAHPAAIELAERLAELAPGDLDHVFFTNGGSEAVEAAWKIVREHFVANGEPQRLKAIARDRRLPRRDPRRALVHRRRYEGPFGAPAIDVHRVSNTNAFRAPDGDDPEAFCARLLAELERRSSTPDPTKWR